MKSLLLIFAVFYVLSCSILLGQIEQIPDQPVVPDVISYVNNFDKILIVRLKSGTDMLKGLNEAAADNKIKNGIILAGIGSVTSYHVHVVSSSVLPPDNAFIREEWPYDLVAANGYIIDGRVHAHITLSDDTKAIGGHLEPGTHALTFIIVTIGVLREDADLSNLDNYTWH